VTRPAHRHGVAGFAFFQEAVLGIDVWPHDLSDAEILERLLALNRERVVP
jgi:hypothetical protein